MTVITNLVRNPSAEVDHTTGVAYSGGVTGSRETGFASVGSACFKVITPATISTGIALSSPTGLGLTGSALPFIGAIDLQGSGTVNVNVVLRYTDATNTTGTVTTYPLTGAFVRVATPVVTSNSAKTLTSVEIAVRVSSAAAITFYADAAMVVQGSALPAYFDGDTTDTAQFRYDWTGTAGVSTSTRTDLGITLRHIRNQFQLRPY